MSPGDFRDSLANMDREALEDAHDDLEVHHARLEIRFGSEHELVAVYNSSGSNALAVVSYADLIEQASGPHSTLTSVTMHHPGCL